MKRTLAWLLTLALLLTCCVQAGAETEPDTLEEPPFVCTVSDGEVTIFYCEETIAGNVIIPETIGGYPVTTLDSFALAWCQSMTAVLIPESVVSIGDSAFFECISLSEVYYAGTEAQWEQITIGVDNECLTDAVLYCQAQPSDMPENPEIPEYPDEPEYPELTDITPYLTYGEKDGVITVYDCDTSVSGEFYLPDTLDGCPVVAIGMGAFRNCSALTALMLPEGITSIAKDAFRDCTGLIYVEIPETVTTIGDLAFSGCSSLITATVPAGVTSLGAYAFADCSQLLVAEIGPGLTAIPKCAYQNCAQLSAIFLPETLSSVGYGAFENCTALEEVYYPGTEAQWNAISIADMNECLTGAEFYYEWSLDEEFPEEITQGWLTYIVVDDEAVVYYCDEAASGNVVIPETIDGYAVTTIDELAFAFCEEITAVTIPFTVISIGESAFYDCPALTDVYYTGSETEWDQIEIGIENECLTEANIHFETPLVPDVPDIPDVPEITGDLDGNGDINEDDAIYLLQYVLLPDLFPVTQYVDYDGSEEVNEDDAIYLLQHVLMPDLFPIE